MATKNLLSDYISLALDFEDRLGQKVYGEYLKRDTWPASLSNEAFLLLSKEISKLIADTASHKNNLEHLLHEIQLT